MGFFDKIAKSLWGQSDRESERSDNNRNAPVPAQRSRRPAPPSVPDGAGRPAAPPSGGKQPGVAAATQPQGAPSRGASGPATAPKVQAGELKASAPASAGKQAGTESGATLNQLLNTSGNPAATPAPGATPPQQRVANPTTAAAGPQTQGGSSAPAGKLTPAPNPIVNQVNAAGGAQENAGAQPESLLSAGGIFGGSLDDDDFDQLFDDAFASIRSPSEVGPSDNAYGLADEDAAVHELFADIAANYARPVKNFIFELRRGTATKDWIDICKPAMHSISRAAAGMNLEKAAKRMEDFEEALSMALAADERVLGGETRDLLLSCYDELIEVMPKTFLIGEEEQKREGIIINANLKQIPDLGRVTVERLYKAGLTSLDTLFLARTEELSIVSGIPDWLAERICAKFKDYRASLVEGEARNADSSAYDAKLSGMVKNLKRFHKGFEHAAENEWTNPALTADKRRLRYERQAAALQINVVLAEMGEVDLVTDLDKLSFDNRIIALEEYLSKRAMGS